MQNRFLWVLMGIVSLLGGLFALANPVLASGFATLVIAFVFMAFGVAQVIAAFRDETNTVKFWTILLGIMWFLIGLMILGRPLMGMVVLTTLIAIAFLFGGAAKIAYAFALEDRKAFWMVLISGVASLALGVIIFMDWPVSAVSTLGILLGVELVADGVSSFALAFSKDKTKAAAT